MKSGSRCNRLSINGATKFCDHTASTACLPLVAQTCSLPYRRFSICGCFHAPPCPPEIWRFRRGSVSQTASLRNSAARRSCNRTLPLLHLMEERAGERRCLGRVILRWPLSSVLSPLLRRGERRKNPRFGKFARLATIFADTDDRLKICATTLAHGCCPSRGLLCQNLRR